MTIGLGTHYVLASSAVQLVSGANKSLKSKG
jgi:hypothetical protein